MCLLYWGEGTKTNSQFRLCNSDDRMIVAVHNWLIENGYSSKIRLSIYYHADTNFTEDEIKTWWSERLGGFPLRQFAKSVLKPPGKGAGKGKLPHGTCHLAVYSVSLLRMVLGGIEWLKENGI